MGITELLVYSDICGIEANGASLSFVVLLATGFLAGFSHCVGMCGPLVSTFVLQQRTAQAKSQGRPHGRVQGSAINRAQNDTTTALLVYQFGRLTSYIALGLLAGAFGSVVRIAVVAQDWQIGMSILMGLLMLIAGLNLLGWWPLQWHLLPSKLLRKLSGWMRSMMGRNHPAAHFGLGLGNGLLPCGAVYTVSLLAAATGSPLRGGLTMFLFGLGTLPAMLATGLFAAQASVRVRSQLYRVAALLIMAVGLQLMLRGLALNNTVSHLSIAGVMLW